MQRFRPACLLIFTHAIFLANQALAHATKLFLSISHRVSQVIQALNCHWVYVIRFMTALIVVMFVFILLELTEWLYLQIV